MIDGQCLFLIVNTSNIHIGKAQDELGKRDREKDIQRENQS